MYFFENFSGNLDKPNIIHFTGLSETKKGEFSEIIENLLKNSVLGIMEKVRLINTYA